MLVQIKNLTTGYGRTRVFENVSYTFAGGIAGLVGPNGAGKTTLLRTLLGFLPVEQGEVWVCGFSVPRQAAAARALIGYMPEGECILANFTAVEFVSYLAELAGLPHAVAIERAHAALEYVGLGEARYRTLETYSAGMKQRVKLAQAIVHDPQLLLLDEPTDGMDPRGRMEMLDLLKELGHAKKMHLIICSHLLDDMERIADELILINHGKIVSRSMTKLPTQTLQVYDVRIHGSPSAFAVALAAHGIKMLGQPQGSAFRVCLPEGCDTKALFKAATEAECVVLQLEPIVERAVEIMLHLLKEPHDAHL